MNPIKKIFAAIVFLFIFSGISSAQAEPLNQKDAKGKPHGKWVVYWDRGWKKTDSLHAEYYWYTYYDHGVNLYPMGPRSSKWMVERKGGSSQKMPELLDGEYNWYENGKLRFTDVFANGRYISYKWYYSSGQLGQFFDYTKHWNDQPHSWYAAEYKKQGRLKWEGYSRNGEKGWVIYTSPKND